MTDRTLVPQLPTNSEELREPPLPFLNSEWKSCFYGNADGIDKYVASHCCINKQHWQQQRKPPHWYVSTTWLTSVSCSLLCFLQPPPEIFSPTKVGFSHFVFYLGNPKPIVAKLAWEPIPAVASHWKLLTKTKPLRWFDFTWNKSEFAKYVDWQPPWQLVLFGRVQTKAKCETVAEEWKLKKWLNQATLTCGTAEKWDRDWKEHKDASFPLDSSAICQLRVVTGDVLLMFPQSRRSRC